MALVILVRPAGAAAQVRESARVIYFGSGVISGSVLSEGKERTPLRRAMVTLSRTSVEDIRTAATDERWARRRSPST